MVKIFMKPASAQKPGKENDDEKIAIPEGHEAKPTSSVRCWAILLILAAVSLILVAVICSARHLSHLRRPIEDSLFHCRVVYEDSYNPPKLRQHELEENIGIYFDDNYERISVPLPRFGSSDPADIIHDFNNGLTAYYDIALDKCYVSDLNTTTVMPPSSLWDMLLNLQVGTYLPQTYIVREEMVVTGRVKNMRQLGPFIHRMCFGKDTYRLRLSKQQRVERRETKRCSSIRHLENMFAVETKICHRV